MSSPKLFSVIVGDPYSFNNEQPIYVVASNYDEAANKAMASYEVNKVLQPILNDQGDLRSPYQPHTHSGQSAAIVKSVTILSNIVW